MRDLLVCIYSEPDWHRLSAVLRVIFFFKQKTAYEMRISDWSSDVCSSDLQDNGFQRQDRRSRGAAGRSSAALSRAGQQLATRNGRQRRQMSEASSTRKIGPKPLTGGEALPAGTRRAPPISKAFSAIAQADYRQSVARPLGFPSFLADFPQERKTS